MFWGAEVQFDKKFVPTKEEYANLHLRNVSVLWAKEKLSLVCTIKSIENDIEEEKDYVICHLDNQSRKNTKLNLFFDLSNQDITFSVIGKGKVCLIGNLETKEGKTLTNELVKNLKPQMQDAKRKMLLELFKLAQENSTGKAIENGDDEGEEDGDDNEDEYDEDLDDEEEYEEGMDLEDDDDEEDEEEEDLKEQQKKQKQIQNEKQDKKQNVQKKENNNQKVQNNGNNKNNNNNNNKLKKQNSFHLTSQYKPKNEQEIEKDEFAAL